MTSVFDWQTGNKVAENRKGYINKVFLPPDNVTYGQDYPLNLPPHNINKTVKLPIEGNGWVIGQAITYQFPDNIYFNSDESKTDVYLFIDHDGDKVTADSLPLSHIDTLRKHNIPNFESQNIKEHIISINKKFKEKGDNIKWVEKGNIKRNIIEDIVMSGGSKSEDEKKEEKEKKQEKQEKSFYLSELLKKKLSFKKIISSKDSIEKIIDDILKKNTDFSDVLIKNTDSNLFSNIAAEAQAEPGAPAPAPAEEEAAPAAEEEAPEEEEAAPAAEEEEEAPAAEEEAAPAAEEEAAAAEERRLEIEFEEAKKAEEDAAAALDGDYDSASEGDGVDMDVINRDEEAQEKAEGKMEVAKAKLNKFRVANAAILATIMMRKKAENKSNVAQSQTE